jgi:hypothetical protein
MLLPFLMHKIQTEADDLAQELLNDVMTNPRTRFLHKRSREELRKVAWDFYRHLGDWLAGKDEAAVEAIFHAVGRKQAADGVPLSAIVYAWLLCKHHLWAFVRRNDVADTELELYEEEEVAVRVGQFFDRAIYHTIRGYEDELAGAPAHAGGPAAERGVPRPL